MDSDDEAAAIAMSLGQEVRATPAASSPVDAAIVSLKSNAPAALKDAGSVQVLSTLLGNLAKNPAEEKFRRVKLSNAKIAKALSCTGAEALLLAAGFVKSDEFLEVPSGADVSSSAQAALDALTSAFGEFMLAAQLRAEGAVRCVCALPNGKLATGAMDNCIRVYSAGKWSEPQILLGHEKRSGVSGVLALISDPADPVGLASAGRDGKILLWRNNSISATLVGHGEGVTGTNVHVVSALGRRADGTLLSGGWDKTARVWNKDNGQLDGTLQGHEIAVNAVVGLPTGEVVTGSGDQTIGVWNGAQRVRSIPAKSPVRALVSCGGTCVAAATNDGMVRLWDVASGQQMAESRVADSYVLSLAFMQRHASGAGELAVGADDGTSMVFEVDGACLRQVQTLQLCGEVYGLAFLENGDIAAACGDDSCVVWTRNSSRAAAPALRQDFDARIAALAAARSAASGGANAPAPSGGGSWDFSFPVDFGRQKMTLQWNRGEDPQTVAARFIQQNGLDASHTGDVVTFVMQAQQQQGQQRQQGTFDFSFPVEVMDGRRLTISWNRGDNPQQVATQFAMQHGGIGPAELPDIVNFIQQASGGPSPPPMMQQAPPPVVASPEMQQQAIMQVMEMGFEESAARGALQATNWSVEAAIARLLG
eukprot:TRINITY_DN19368_c0_g4_i1.p1 TRINITY_DN19368_c0_g4~~TRINITY_DN19368_c0_g4_i1.p1  ORF type:complete len:674 (-),score=113.19 TRINITY_DN19368_c0_g4_i1:148-2097(-)